MELSHSFLHNAHRLNSSIEVQVLRNISFTLPTGSMYGIYIYANIGGILMVNVTIYSIHGSYGYIYIYNYRHYSIHGNYFQNQQTLTLGGSLVPQTGRVAALRRGSRS